MWGEAPLLNFQPSPNLWRAMRGLLQLSSVQAARGARIDGADLRDIELYSEATGDMFTTACRHAPAMMLWRYYTTTCGSVFRLWQSQGMVDITLPKKPRTEWVTELGYPSPSQCRAVRYAWGMSIDEMAAVLTWSADELESYERINRDSPLPDQQPTWWGDSMLLPVTNYFHANGAFPIDPRLTGTPEFGIRFRTGLDPASVKEAA